MNDDFVNDFMELLSRKGKFSSSFCPWESVICCVMTFVHVNIIVLIIIMRTRKNYCSHC